MFLQTLTSAPVRFALVACACAGAWTPAGATGLSRDDVRRDLRFSPLAPLQAARVKVLATPEAFPYFGIPNSGCARGKVFVRAELASAFDGAPAGQRVVLRLDDTAFPKGKVGDTLAFTGLRRAGVGPDGTFVYCGKLPGTPAGR